MSTRTRLIKQIDLLYTYIQNTYTDRDQYLQQTDINTRSRSTYRQPARIPKPNARGACRENIQSAKIKLSWKKNNGKEIGKKEFSGMICAYDLC